MEPDEKKRLRAAAAELASDEPELVSALVVNLEHDVALEVIRDQIVDPDTATLEDLRDAVWGRIREWLAEEDSEFNVVLDHVDSLLKTAREYALEGRHEYSLMFYATFIEHLLNRIIRRGSDRLRLDAPEAEALMRNSIADKVGVTWRLLFGSPFPNELRGDVLETASARNSFVHYKWRPLPNELVPITTAREQAERERAERAVIALQELERRETLPTSPLIAEWFESGIPLPAPPTNKSQRQPPNNRRPKSGARAKPTP